MDNDSNNTPLVPEGVDNETNNDSTNTTNDVVVGENKSVHPNSGNIKDMHGIDTSAFSKNNGPRIATDSGKKTAIHAEAFNAVHKEKVEELKVDKGPEKGKGGLIVLMILLCLFVVFLPNITDLINKYKGRVITEDITDGELRCSMKKTTSNFDVNYEADLSFKDKRITAFKYSVTTRGDANKDKADLEELEASCDKLGSLAQNVEGLDVICEFTDDKLTETQKIYYETLDTSMLRSAYAEMGGTYPEFEKGDAVDEVQRNLQSTGYTCNKIK